MLDITVITDHYNFLAFEPILQTLAVTSKDRLYSQCTVATFSQFYGIIKSSYYRRPLNFSYLILVFVPFCPDYHVEHICLQTPNLMHMLLSRQGSDGLFILHKSIKGFQVSWEHSTNSSRAVNCLYQVVIN